ncbi:hypothetical protein [Rhizobium leguminosarum]|uniref:hypothetical protein n=1 Tax=Rhizobium leguminosarum TaxID=384 RepID=UPI003F94AFA8
MANQKLFQVTLSKGRSHAEFGKWLANMMRMNGRAPDYGGLNNVALLATGGDEVFVRSEATLGMSAKFRKDVVVEEVTKKSANAEHSHWSELIEGYFSYVDLKS